MDRRWRVLCVACLLLVGCVGQSSVQRSPQITAQPSAPGTSTTSDQPWTLQLVSVVQGLERPVHAAHAGDGSGRLFVVEKAGRIKVVRDGVLISEPFLDITDRVGAGGSEQGLLSVAFHPQYGTNGLFFVNYTDLQGDTVIARFRVTSDADRADPASSSTVLTVEQPASNHNGGQIAFGPDGYLYIGMGDGGGAGDRYENAQNRGVLLGKMLRIDVDADEPYGIPSDNPFVGAAGTRPEIWAMGLRNPWRFSFDRTTGDMFIGDVGQNRLEEINFEPAGQGGADYGWNTMEGGECYQPSRSCEREGLVEPIAEYGHEHGCSVTGGMRYRGSDVPAFGTAYFFGDYCSGTIWMLTNTNDRWTMTHVLDADISLSSFAEDEQGELYVLDMSEGTMYRLGATS